MALSSAISAVSGRRYLAENSLEPKALLRDDVHLNAHGEFVMAEFVKSYLRYDPKLGPSPAEVG